MLTELHGKGGQVCSAAKQGQIRCPLIIRPTSEDVITGQLVQILRILSPRWWLPDLLNQALGTQRFRRQIFRGLRILPWVNQPRYTREFLPWDEGSSQIDITITWENPPTTIFVELKYASDVSTSTANNDGKGRWPADQLIRNLRVGLWQTAWLRPATMLPTSRREFALILLAPQADHPLIRRYRDVEQLRAAIPHAELLQRLPAEPFVGEISYAQLGSVLRKQSRWFCRWQRAALEDFLDYLDFKRCRLTQARTQSISRDTRELPFQE